MTFYTSVKRGYISQGEDIRFFLFFLRMDAAHTQELERILQNRRSRGALLSSASLAESPRGNEKTRKASPARQQATASSPSRARSTATVNQSPSFSAARQDNTSSTGQPFLSAPLSTVPSPSFAVPRLSYGNAADDTAAIRRVAAQQEELRAVQAAQDRRVDVLHTDVRRDLETVKSVLFSVVQSQQGAGNTPGIGPTGGPSSPAFAPRLNLSMPAVLSSFATKQANASYQAHNHNSRSVVSGYAVAAPTPPPAQLSMAPTALRSAIKSSGALTGPSTAKPITIPVPLIFGNYPSEDRVGQMQQSPSFSLRSPAASAANRSARGLQQATSAPPEPPVSVRPLSSSPIDIASSVTILSTGDWFYKWNRSGTEVQPRFVWLDTTKFVLTWSRQQTRSSAFSSYVRAENCSQVRSSQVVERDEMDRPRVFYVLLIQADDRLLQLATEVREKIDVWYEAIGNLIAYCRAGGPLQKIAESSE
jgi:hypothetical protein